VRDHVARLVDEMRLADVAATIVFHTSNMLAFLGTTHSSSDRLVCGAVTRAGALLAVCPAFERPGIAEQTSLPAIHTWEEHEDPYARLAEALATTGVRGGRIATDGRTWLDAHARFAAALRGCTLVPGEALLGAVRLCKTAAEIELMRQAQRRGERVYAILRDLVRPGVTERGLRDEVSERCAAEGLSASPMIQTGPNAAVPHHDVDDSPLQPGHTLVVDSVTSTAGYINDLTRTYAVGTPSPRAREAYRVVRAAQAAAIAAARAGVVCEQLDALARQVITDAGFGPFFIHRLGHGLGIECHEPPYLVRGNALALRPGMCMTIEPGIYVPGEFGIRIEDDVVITESGCEVLRHELPTDVTDAFER
jgi:Xaa-Pro dipeptidase